MNKLIKGIIVGAVGILTCGAIYKRGYLRGACDGIDECKRIVETAIHTQDAVKKEEEA